MYYRILVADPHDPEQILEIEYEARREPDQLDVGWHGRLMIEADGLGDLSPAARTDILDQIHGRHLDV